MPNAQPIDVRELARWLATPGAYPHSPARVEHVETHISHVFLADDLVFKLKKPVKYDFLDFSTLERREHACREELRLNRRLATQTYLDVVPIVQAPDGSLAIGGSGPIVDWLVQMRRLPAEWMLDALYRRGGLTAEQIDRLATTLVGFYRSLAALPITAAEYRSRCIAHVRGNRDELLAVRHHLPQGVVERVHGFQLQMLALAPELFDERVSAGRIVEGHGDLRPEHICLTEEVAIFDCIEFSADFRRIDVADELAFLAAECDFLGAEWVGPQLLGSYSKQSGDRIPPVLLAFYKSYRACVRAKVAALRADQLQGPGQEEAVAEAHRHLEWADRYVQPWLAPLVVAVGGLSGTGKTTVATAIAETLGAELLRTDVVRQELYGTARQDMPVDAGIYTKEARQRVYDELLQQGAQWHRRGISVVLDGTFLTVEGLRRAQSLVTQPRGRFLAVECTCSPEVAEQRIGRRLAAGRDASEARPEMHAIQRARWEAWPSEVPQVTLDTEQPLEQQVEQVLTPLRSLIKSDWQTA
jgi:aminoglycoside phosphotransferase family enzyme/predicted kinase